MCDEFVTRGRKRTRGTVVVAANSAWNIANFRKPLIQGLLAHGWRVVAVAPPDGHFASITALGAEFVPIRIDNSGTSVVRDARLLKDYLRIFRRLRPQA